MDASKFSGSFGFTVGVLWEGAPAGRGGEEGGAGDDSLGMVEVGGICDCVGGARWGRGVHNPPVHLGKRVHCCVRELWINTCWLWSQWLQAAEQDASRWVEGRGVGGVGPRLDGKVVLAVW